MIRGSDTHLPVEEPCCGAWGCAGGCPFPVGNWRWDGSVPVCLELADDAGEV